MDDDDDDEDDEDDDNDDEDDGGGNRCYGDSLSREPREVMDTARVRE